MVSSPAELRNQDMAMWQLILQQCRSYGASLSWEHMLSVPRRSSKCWFSNLLPYVAILREEHMEKWGLTNSWSGIPLRPLRPKFPLWFYMGLYKQSCSQHIIPKYDVLGDHISNTSHDIRIHLDLISPFWAIFPSALLAIPNIKTLGHVQMGANLICLQMYILTISPNMVCSLKICYVQMYCMYY